MPDNTLQFETRVNLAGLNSGVAEAQAQIETLSSTVAQAMANAKQATDNLADAQIKLGASAEQGNAQAKQVIQEYADEVKRTSAAVVDAKKTESDAVRQAVIDQKRQYEEYTQSARQSGQQLSLEQKRQYEEYIAQSRAEAAAEKGVVSSRMAASAELRVLEGNAQGSTRAVAALISQFPALASAAQNAFLAFGLIAVGEIAYEVGHKIYEAFDLGGERARKTAQEIHEVNQELQHSTDALDVQIDKLQQEQAKLEHKPFNGAKLVLDEAALAADNLDEKLKAVNQRLLLTIEGMSGSGLQRVFGASATGYEKTMVTEHQRHIDEQPDTQGQLKESLSFAASLQIRLNELKEKQKLIDDTNVESALAGGSVVNTSYQNEINAVNALMGAQQREQRVIQTTIDLGKEQAVVQKLKDDKQPKGKDPMEQYLRDLEDQLAQENAIRQRSAGEVASYWAKYLNDFTVGSSEYHTVQESMTRSIEENHKKIVAERKAQTEELHKQDELDLQGAEAVAKGLQATHKMMEQIYEQQATSQHDKNQGQIQLQETKVEAGASLGLTDPKKDLEMLRDLHQQAIAEDERYIQQELAIYAKEPEKVAELQKKLELDHNKALNQQIQDTTRILQRQEQLYKSAYSTITQDFNQTINKMITTTESPAKAFAQMLNEMLGQLANFVLQYLEKKAEMWLLDEILGKTTATAAAVTQITASAAAAGAGAYAAIAPIPIVGPALAPGAAAASYAGALSFLSLAAFEAGGVVAGGANMPVPIMAHAGERVLSAPQTQRFDQMVNGGGGSGHTTHINYNPSVSAFDNSGLKSTLQSHKDTILDIVRQGYRQGALGR